MPQKTDSFTVVQDQTIERVVVLESVKPTPSTQQGIPGFPVEAVVAGLVILVLTWIKKTGPRRWAGQTTTRPL